MLLIRSEVIHSNVACALRLPSKCSKPRRLLYFHRQDLCQNNIGSFFLSDQTAQTFHINAKSLWVRASVRKWLKTRTIRTKSVVHNKASIPVMSRLSKSTNAYILKLDSFPAMCGLVFSAGTLRPFLNKHFHPSAQNFQGLHFSNCPGFCLVNS